MEGKLLSLHSVPMQLEQHARTACTRAGWKNKYHLPRLINTTFTFVDDDDDDND